MKSNEFWEIAGKIYLFLTPSKTDGRVPSQQGAPTTCNLTYWEVSQQTYVQTLLATLGVALGAKFSPSVGQLGGGRFLTNNTNNSNLDIKSPQTTWIFYFQGNLSFQGHQFFQISQPAWGTYPLGAPGNSDGNGKPQIHSKYMIGVIA